jgi:hypothetical protein
MEAVQDCVASWQILELAEDSIGSETLCPAHHGQEKPCSNYRAVFQRNSLIARPAASAERAGACKVWALCLKDHVRIDKNLLAWLLLLLLLLLMVDMHRNIMRVTRQRVREGTVTQVQAVAAT